MIDYKTSDILDIYKNKYFAQNGSPLQIGSDDFAAASVHSYVLGVLISAFNREAKNRFLGTATGDSLDGIAATFGLSRPKGHRATIRVEFTYKSQGGYPTFAPAGEIVIEHGGTRFTNVYPLTIYSGGTLYETQTLYAIEPGSQYNNIPADAETTIVLGDYYISAVNVLTESAGGTSEFPKTQEGDEAFREWLTVEIQSLAGAGTYLAYEARAKNADERVKGVYVLKQGDAGYQKGEVQIYIYTDDATLQVLDIVHNACNDPAFRPVGDFVVLHESTAQSLNVNCTIQTTYPEQFSASCEDRNARILSEYIAELEDEINKPFAFGELCTRLMERDSDGVYASDAKVLGMQSTAYPRPIYPSPGCRIHVNANSISWNVQIGGE